MSLQRPIYIDPAPGAAGRGLAGLGEAARSCGWVTPFVLGGIALYALPPLLSGVLDGIREARAERRR